jgi:flagellar biosynthesis/type III secretory pathway protein FliH
MTDPRSEGEESPTEAMPIAPGANHSSASRPPALMVVGAVLLCLALGAVGYFIGRSTGEDLDAANAAGEAAGKVRGTEIGSRRGYASGFKAGRQAGYKQTYADAYRQAYRKAYEDAGLETPARDEIEIE